MVLVNRNAPLRSSTLMKSYHTLQTTTRVAALAVAFVSGWALHYSMGSKMGSANDSQLYPRLERSPAPMPVARDGVALLAPAAGATTVVSESTPLTVGAVLAALRATEIPGAAGITPLERHRLLASFAAADPLTAMTYIDTLPAGERRDAIVTVMSTWSRQNPEAAAKYLETEIDGLGLGADDAAAGAAAVAGEWSRLSLHDAAAWAAELPDEIREAAHSVVIGRMAATDPQAVQNYFNALSDNTVRVEAAAPLAAQWAATDPSAAGAWATSLSAGEEQAAALSGVTSAWMLSDPNAASQWVKNLPNGIGKDAAIAALVDAASIRNDPEAALAWAQAISPGQARDAMTNEIEERIRLRDSLP